MPDYPDTMTLKIIKGTNAIRVTKPGTTETYDRESILYELLNPQNLGNGEEIKRMQTSSETKIFKELSKNHNNEDYEAQRTVEESRESLTQRLRETLEDVPDALLHIFMGRNRPGDCGQPSDRKPEWLDENKLRRGQKFAQDNMVPIFFSGMLSFFATLTFDDSLKPLILTGKSGTPYTAFKRYLSTTLRIRNWFIHDLWTKGTAAQKDISIVRAMHAAVRRRLGTSTNEEVDAATTIPNALCPAREMLVKDFSESCAAPVIGQCLDVIDRNSCNQAQGMSQAEMALSQWAFIGFITSFPNEIGIHFATDEDLEAFCHLWRSIGYQLGIEDEFNFCRGTLEEIRQRSHDFVETWVKPNFREITPEWEHMVRCAFTGMSYIIPGITYEVGLLCLADILKLHMPRLTASLSYKDWIIYSFIKYFLRYAIKIPGMMGLANFVLDRAIDQAEKYSPKELEAIRIKLSDDSSSKTEINEGNPAATSSWLWGFVGLIVKSLPIQFR